MNTKTSDRDLEYYLSGPKPEYESKGQEMIGHMLDEYHVAFNYKEPYLVWEKRQRRIRRPDFTLPTYNNALIEYISNPDQATDRSKSIYRENNIAALFLDEQDLAEPNWKQQLYEKLEEIYHQPMGYLTNSYSEERH